MSNCIVVQSQLTAAQASKTKDFSVFGFRNTIPISSVSGQAEDPEYLFINSHDNKDATQYSPLATSGSVVIEFVQADASIIDYVGIAIHNGGTAGLTGQVEVDPGTGYIIAATFNTLTDNKPFLLCFDQITGNKQRITLNFTSKCYIGAIHIGESIQFPRTPSRGFQPGKTALQDKAIGFTSGGNNFVKGRRELKGHEAKGSFDYIDFSGVNLWWDEYQNHVIDSKATFFKWNNSLDEVIFGRQDPDKLRHPTYSSGLYTTIAFEFNGYA
ncbi:MAG: hypothetical protein ACJAYB_000003 [Psychromonas sp.]|jgi:hypothetical protein